MNKFKLALGIAFTSLLLTGCGNSKLKDGKELVIEMNGIKITANDLYDSLKYKYGVNVLLDKMDTMLMEKEYKTTQEMKDQIESQILSAKEQLGSDFNNAILYYYGVKTEREFYNFLEMNMKKNLAVKEYATSLIKDEDIQKYYDEKSIGDIKAYHILIKPDTTSSMTDEQIKAKEDEAKALAKDLISQIDAADNKLEKFKELAKSKSEDESNASKGGELGSFNRGQMVEEFEDAAVSLKVGSYTKEPVKTKYGYHIIYKTEQKEKGKLDDTMKKNIKEILANEKVKNTTNINVYAMEALREKYKLKIYDAGLKVQYDSYIKDQKAQ